jgi:hypothetical protein
VASHSGETVTLRGIFRVTSAKEAPFRIRHRPLPYAPRLFDVLWRFDPQDTSLPPLSRAARRYAFLWIDASHPSASASPRSWARNISFAQKAVRHHPASAEDRLYRKRVDSFSGRIVENRLGSPLTGVPELRRARSSLADPVHKLPSDSLAMPSRFSGLRHASHVRVLLMNPQAASKSVSSSLGLHPCLQSSLIRRLTAMSSLAVAIRK